MLIFIAAFCLHGAGTAMGLSSIVIVALPFGRDICSSLWELGKLNFDFLPDLVSVSLPASLSTAPPFTHFFKPYSHPSPYISFFPFHPAWQ
jgi:hypothetical protein